MMARSRARLTWEQKLSVLVECERRGLTGGQRSLSEVGRWAKQELELATEPTYRTIYQIIRDEERILSKVNSNEREKTREISLTSKQLDEELATWVIAMWRRKVFLSDSLIKEKARRILESINSTLPTEQRIAISFSNGWITYLKRRHYFKRYKSYEESGDAGDNAIQEHLPKLQALIGGFHSRDVFNADEFELLYKSLPISTIGLTRLQGRKRNLDRITFLRCSNADGTERLPPLVVGRAKQLQCFGDESPSAFGFDYTAGPKAWMNRHIFWLGSNDSTNTYQEWLGGKYYYC